MYKVAFSLQGHLPLKFLYIPLEVLFIHLFIYYFTSTLVMILFFCFLVFAIVCASGLNIRVQATLLQPFLVNSPLRSTTSVFQYLYFKCLQSDNAQTRTPTPNPLKNVFVHLFINYSMILKFVSVKPYTIMIFLFMNLLNCVLSLGLFCCNVFLMICWKHH